MTNIKQFEDFAYKLRKKWNCYIDAEILEAPHDPENNIGFLIESRGIISGVYDSLVPHFDQIIDNFKYIFVHDRSLLSLHPKIQWAPASFVWIENPKIYSKSYILSMITSQKTYTDVQRFRVQTAYQLQNSGVPIFGRGFSEIDKKEYGLCPYMFSVAIENSIYSGYFTEKIMDCFATGTVPIYYGDPDIDKFFNPDGIISLKDSLDLSSLNEELYYDKMPAIQENLEIVKQFSDLQRWVADKYLGGINE